MYRGMMAIRLFEEQVNDLYTRALMPGLAHLYIGEEAVAVGICEALRQDDYITSTHRGHGHCLAKGAAPDRMFAELLGKEAGYCKGKGGSMHIADPATGNLGANAIVGGSAGIATGAAFSAKHLGTERVAVCFFGEGALGQGVLYEVMNIARSGSCRSSTSARTTCTTSTRISRRPRRARFWRGRRRSAFPAESVDGQDVRAVHAAAEPHGRAGARRAKGPRFLLCNTYRYRGHHVGDMNREYYRAKQEEAEWMTERDPIKLLSDWLMRERLADASAARRDSRTKCKAEMERPWSSRCKAPYPSSRSKWQEDVYA